LTEPLYRGILIQFSVSALPFGVFPFFFSGGV
jgi:hypothetical protein